MSDPSGTSGSPYESSSRQTPWGTIAAIAAFLIFGSLTFWILHEKKSDKARQEAQAVLDKELYADEEAMKAQRAKLDELTRQVETMRTAIQMGQYKDGKAAVAEFKKLAEEQRKAREDFTIMADAYNKKVAEFQKLQP